MPHVHVIDGKVQTFDDTTCPFCHPEQAQLPQQQQEEQLPRVYRKGGTVVAKLSRITMITTNFYEKEHCFLLTLQQIMRDQNKKFILGQDQMPMWKKITVRLNASTLKDYLNKVALLINEIETQTPAPSRD